MPVPAAGDFARQKPLLRNHLGIQEQTGLSERLSFRLSRFGHKPDDFDDNGSRPPGEKTAHTTPKVHLLPKWPGHLDMSTRDKTAFSPDLLTDLSAATRLTSTSRASVPDGEAGAAVREWIGPGAAKRKRGGFGSPTIRHGE